MDRNLEQVISKKKCESFSLIVAFSQYLNFKIEDEIDLSTTENIMQLQNNSKQKEMETLKKAREFIKGIVNKTVKGWAISI